MRALKAWINQQQVQVRRECCKRWLWLKQCITAELTPRALFTLWYCSIIAVSLQCCLIRLFTSVAAPCCWDNGIYTTQTDYRVIAIYTSAGRSCSATLDQERGHCHGTRYVVRQVSRRYIKAKIACGEPAYAGNVLFIPRIPLSPTSWLTDNCTGGVAMRKSAEHSFFCQFCCM